jgi:tetratricopeptide (TPR) repeat protein
VLPLLVLGCAAWPARADQVVVGTRDYPDVTIVAFEKGKLAFRSGTGNIERSDLRDVKLIVVNSVADVIDLNQAEQFYRREGYDQAVIRYERALRSAREFWITLILARLQQVYNQIGPLETLVDNFAHLAERDALSALSLLPDAVPAPKPGEAQPSLKRLLAAEGGADSERSRAPLTLLRYAVLLRAGEPGLDELAPAVATAPLDPDAAGPTAYRLKLDALGHLRGTELRAEVLNDIDEAVESVPQTILPDLLLMKGRILLEDAKDRETYIRAGWTFMRVPIHFPDDIRAADGLLGAAQVYERLGNLDKATALVRECLSSPRAAQATQEHARALLERLNAAKPRPPVPARR